MITRTWTPKDPAQAFFPVELRPVFMASTADNNKYAKLSRHFAVVDIEKIIHLQ